MFLRVEVIPNGESRLYFFELACYSASLQTACFGVHSYSKFQHPFTPRKDGPFINVIGSKRSIPNDSREDRFLPACPLGKLRRNDKR